MLGVEIDEEGAMEMARRSEELDAWQIGCEESEGSLRRCVMIGKNHKRSCGFCIKFIRSRPIWIRPD